MTHWESLAIAGLALLLVLAAVLWVGKQRARFKRLAGFTVVLTFVVVVVGAFVRLTDAGLGCPDWPGCYGDLTPATAKAHIQAAHAADPLGPVSMAKAWKEMVHRYIAALLGAIILALAIAAWRNRSAWRYSPWLATSIVGVVMLQGAFGAWTVTLLLKPAIVTGHLIGGLLTLCLLQLLFLSSASAPSNHWPLTAQVRQFKPLRVLAWLALLVVITQIVLGGWVSTNYAALACTDFPRCHGAWVPQMNFDHAFDIIRKLGMTAQGEPISLEALTAIHWTHRVFAVVVLTVVSVLGALLIVTAESSIALSSSMSQPAPNLKRHGVLILALLTLQLTLGVANVVLGLPLAVAVAHNAGAALLLLSLITLLYRLK